MIKNKKLNIRYRTRYTFLFCLAAVLLFTGASQWAHIHAVDDIIKTNLSNMQELSTHDQRLIRNEINQHVNNLKKVAAKIRMQRPKTEQQLISTLSSEKGYFDGSDYIALVASDGTVYRSNSLISKDQRVLETCKEQYGDFFMRYEQWGNTFQKDKDGTSPVVIKKQQQGDFFSRYDRWDKNTAEYRHEYILIGTKARNLYLGNLRFDYIIDICLLDNLSSKINVSSYNGKGISTLIDGNGDFIINRGKKSAFFSRDNIFDDIDLKSLHGFSSLNELKNKVITAPAPFPMEIEKNNKKYIVLFSPFIENTWSYVTIVPRQVFEEQSTLLFRKYQLFIGPIILLIFLGGFILFKLREKAKDAALQRLIVQEQKKNLDILGILSSEYTSIYYVDLKTDIMTPYVVSKETSNSIPNSVLTGTHFSESFSKYVADYVYGKDKQEMLKYGTSDKIINALSGKKSVTVVYKKNSEGIHFFYELKIVKTGEDKDTPSSAVLAFTDRDIEVASRYVLEKFGEEYTAVFMVDLVNDRYRIFKIPEEIRHVHLKSGGSWTGMGKLFLQECSEQSRKDLEPVYNFPVLQKELQSDKRREYLYQLKQDVKLWRRAVVQPIEEENGVTTIALFRVSMLDKYTAENENLRRKIQDQQAELRRALAMAQSANKAKTTFLNNMSHDIRTPMNAIIGFTGMAVKYIHDAERVQEYLYKINISSQHLLSLINDILDMSRIESGKITINEEEENLPDIMHNLKNLIMADITKKHQKLFISSFNVRHEKVICDKLRLNQILLNLISNAAKYTGTNGTISIHVSELNHIVNDFSLFEFRVKDNGIGIPSEFLKVIFDPFTRVNSSTVSGIQGTGLGMAITKNIVQMMNGTIEANSEEGVGSEFIVRIPFRISENQRELKQIRALKDKCVLIVDPDEDNNQSISAMLKEMGINAEWTVSGKDALLRISRASAQGDNYSTFILAYAISDINGIELARQIRDTAGSEVPIFLLSVYHYEMMEKEAKETGISGFFSKPIFISELQRSLAEYFGEEENIPANQSSPAATQTFNFTGFKILLVEDNDLNREIAQDILKEENMIVDTAEDGLAALEKVSNSKPGQYDLILMDIQMPNMDGHEATRRIRQLPDPELSSIPIFAMTANAFIEDKALALASGMNDHIAKPIDKNALFEAIAKIFNKKKL